MATFNATSAVQTLGNGTNNTGNDTFNIPSGSVQAGDVFNGGTGTDTLSMGNNITINFSVATITAMERLQFGSGGSASFNANQFGGALISDSLTVLGAGGSQAIVINNASNFSAASWTFGSWTSGTDTITINGTSGNDTITGSSEIDTITGGNGADTINAGGGDDIINIANGQFVAGESISGGGGIDSIVLTNATSVDFSSGTITSVGRLTGSSGNDAVIMSALQWAGFSTAINLDGGANDSLSVVASGDISALGIPSTISNIETGNLIGTAGTDTVTLTGAQLNAIIIGSGTINLGLGLGDTINLTSTSSDLNSLGATNASIQGVEAISAATAAAGVTINLGDQNEDFTITGSGQADTITGGSGADTINAGGGADTINGGGGADTINGQGGADTINGQGGADTINGQGGIDTISGGGGTDNINGGAGNDMLTGGAGVDRYIWSAGDGDDTVISTGSGSVSEDIIQINGTFYDYNFVLAGNDLLVGVTADDSYDFATVGGSLRIQDFFAGGDSIAYMEADLGPDNNTFYSPDGGSARIYFSAINGTDQGNYFELIVGTSGDDIMTDTGGAGQNRFVGGAGVDTMTAAAGTMAVLIGGDDGDIMTGADQDDHLRGGSGADIMDGGDGLGDLVRYDRPNGSTPFIQGAFVNLSDTDQTFDFNGGSTTVLAGQAIDNWGDTDALSNIENVRGSAYDDVIVGSAESNFLEGLDGNDIIVGGAGDDIFAGGAGVDTYVWNAGDGYDTITAAGAANEDVILINGTFYDYNFEVDGNDLLVGVAADENYLWADVGGNLRIQDFFVGGDSIAYLEADLGPDNNAFYSPGGGNARIYFNAVTGTDQGNYFEAIIGTSDADVMTDAGGAGQNRFIGFGGDDTMTVAAGSMGVLIGGDGVDTMTGADQDDQLRGGSGNDIMDGGDGIDLVRYDRPSGSTAFTQGAFVNLSDAEVTYDFNDSATTVQAGQAIDNWGDTDNLFSIENVRGSALDDVIVGNTEGNSIEGQGGNDIIVGGAGDDYLVGGGGVDTYVWNADDGYDTIAPAGAADEDVILINGTFYDYNFEVDGNDLLVGVAADENYNWADVGGNLRIQDFFVGGDSIAYLEADLGPANQFYSPGGGNARIYFNAVTGIDQGYYYEAIVGTSDSDVMTDAGGAGLNRFVGLGGDDIMTVSIGSMGVLVGGDGADTMTGADQDDVFRGGAGNDTMDGGDGVDIVRYDRPSGSIAFSQGAFVNLSDGEVTYDFDGTPTTVQAGQAIDNWGDTDSLSNIENVRGSAFDDVLVGNTDSNVIEGLGGNDIIAGGGGVDTYVWNENDGDDTILATGDANEDVIQINGTFNDYNVQFEGNDLIIGVVDEKGGPFTHGGSLRIQDFFAGGDSIAYLDVDLGSENAFYSPNGGNAIIYISAVNGADQGDGFEVIYGTSESDVMTDAGGSGPNAFYGRDGEDTMSVSNGMIGLFVGGNDMDTMTGADQNDEFRGNSGADIMDGMGGIDRVRYDQADGSADFTQGTFVNLSTAEATFDFNGILTTVQAGQAIDNWGYTDTLSNIENVRGSVYDDVIVGSTEVSVIQGLDGYDIIVGGAGDDYLIGGADADTFVFDAIDMGYVDTIEDFEIGIDSLQLDGGLAISLIENYDSDGDFIEDSTLVTLDNTSAIVLANVLDVGDEGDLFV